MIDRERANHLIELQNFKIILSKAKHINMKEQDDGS